MRLPEDDEGSNPDVVVLRSDIATRRQQLDLPRSGKGEKPHCYGGR